MGTATETSVRFQAVAPQFTVPDASGRPSTPATRSGSRSPATGASQRYPPSRPAAVQFFFNRAEGSEARTGRRSGGYDAYVSVAGVDALADELRARGADIIEGPCDRVYRQRELIVKDCNGLVIAFGEDTSGRPA